MEKNIILVDTLHTKNIEFELYWINQQAPLADDLPNFLRIAPVEDLQDKQIVIAECIQDYIRGEVKPHDQLIPNYPLNQESDLKETTDLQLNGSAEELNSDSDSDLTETTDLQLNGSAEKLNSDLRETMDLQFNGSAEELNSDNMLTNSEHLHWLAKDMLEDGIPLGQIFNNVSIQTLSENLELTRYLILDLSCAALPTLMGFGLGTSISSVPPELFDNVQTVLSGWLTREEFFKIVYHPPEEYGYLAGLARVAKVLGRVWGPSATPLFIQEELIAPLRNVINLGQRVRIVLADLDNNISWKLLIGSEWMAPTRYWEETREMDYRIYTTSATRSDVIRASILRWVVLNILLGVPIF